MQRAYDGAGHPSAVIKAGDRRKQRGAGAGPPAPASSFLSADTGILTKICAACHPEEQHRIASAPQPWDGEERQVLQQFPFCGQETDTTTSQNRAGGQRQAQTPTELQASGPRAVWHRTRLPPLPNSPDETEERFSMNE